MQSMRENGEIRRYTSLFVDCCLPSILQRYPNLYATHVSIGE